MESIQIAVSQFKAYLFKTWKLPEGKCSRHLVPFKFLLLQWRDHWLTIHITNFIPLPPVNRWQYLPPADLMGQILGDSSPWVSFWMACKKRHCQLLSWTTFSRMYGQLWKVKIVLPSGAEGGFNNKYYNKYLYLL